MQLSAKWKVTNPEKMVEVFRSLVTEEFNQSNGFKFEGDLFECKIEMVINKPQKALEAMSQIGNVLSFSYNYPDNGKEELDVSEELDQNTQLEPDENDQEPNQPDSGEQEFDPGKVLDRNTQIESGKKDEESKQPDEGRKERKYEKELDSLAKSEDTNNDLISQIAENAVSYPDFVSKVVSRAENLSKEHAEALIEMMLVAPTVKKFTLSTIETVASKKTPINSYTMLKVGDEIKGTFNCTKMDFFKKIIGFVHNWDDAAPAEQTKEKPKAKDNDAKPEDNGSLSANIEYHDGIFPCMLKPTADKVKAVEIMEGKLRQVEDKNNLTLKEKDDDQTPLDEKDVYLQWSNIANLVSEFYF